MYPAENHNYYHRRVTEEFCDKAGIEYVEPPVTKVFDEKNTFVHNQIANKNKVNV